MKFIVYILSLAPLWAYAKKNPPPEAVPEIDGNLVMLAIVLLVGTVLLIKRARDRRALGPAAP